MTVLPTNGLLDPESLHYTIRKDRKDGVKGGVGGGGGGVCLCSSKMLVCCTH